MAGTFPQAWEEVAKVVIIKLGGTVYSYAAITETIDISEPDYPGESIPNVGGGRVWKQSPQEDGEITLEIYPLELDTATNNTGLFEQFVGGTFTSSESRSTDTTWPIGIQRTRDRYRVTILWTNDTTPPATAEAQVAVGKEALRFSAMLCRIISHKTEFTDGVVKTTVTFKFPAMNKDGDILSGQTEAPNGYDYWILKFDGVNDVELGKTENYGRIEYAYYKMAQKAGIDMSECRLLEENGRAHFMTKRFDRIDGKKIHMQSLCGIAHYDFNMPGAYSYEQAFAIMRKLRLSKSEVTQQYRRMIFNVVARNQDDHTKNISFLMKEDGKWELSPAYDVIYSHKPGGKWTSKHQMTLNGKRDDFVINDLIEIGKSNGINKCENIIKKVINAVSDWKNHAKKAGLKGNIISELGKYHRIQDFKSI